jgi:hypothetical protein
MNTTFLRTAALLGAAFLGILALPTDSPAQHMRGAGMHHVPAMPGHPSMTGSSMNFMMMQHMPMQQMQHTQMQAMQMQHMQMVNASTALRRREEAARRFDRALREQAALRALAALQAQMALNTQAGLRTQAAVLANTYSAAPVPMTGNLYNPFAYGSFPAAGYAANGYGANPANYASGGGYGGGAYGMGYGMAAYGAGYGGGYGSDYSPTTASSTKPVSTYTRSTDSSSTDQSSVSRSVLDALGVPTENGQLQWPLGLRVLAPATKAEALRHQVDMLVKQAAAQFASGKASPATVEAAMNATGQLRDLMRHGGGSAAIAEQTRRDAADFLNRLDTALLAMKR